MEFVPRFERPVKDNLTPLKLVSDTPSSMTQPLSVQLVALVPNLYETASVPSLRYPGISLSCPFTPGWLPQPPSYFTKLVRFDKGARARPVVSKRLGSLIVFEG